MSRTLRPGHAALLSALAAVLVYLPALRNGFAYDDVAIIERNPAVHSFDLRALLGDGYWADPELGLWRPLTTLSYALDWAVAPGNAAWFHAVNSGWHALVTALVVLLLARFLPVAAALAGGIVFAVHPVHVEAVANVVGRAELMAMAAAMAAALLWSARAPVRGTAVLSALLFALALLAKESAIMIPALLVLVDVATRALRPANWREWLAARWRALALLAGVGGVYVLARSLVLAQPLPARVDAALELATGDWARVLTALQAWPHHLRLLLFPQLLLADYGPRIIMPAAAPTASVLLGALILLALLLGGLAAWRRDQAVLAAMLLWVPAALLPVSNLFFPVGVIVAERTLYLPSFAVAIAAALVATALARPAWRAAALALLLAAIGAGALRTWSRIPVWQSTDSVFVALLADRPDAFRGQWHLARMLRVRNRPEEALAAYRRALALWPHRRGLLAEAAAYEATQGDARRARDLSRHTVARWPRDLDAQRLLAATSLDLGDTATARTAVRAGLALDSTDAVLRRMAAAIGITPAPPR